MIKCKNCGKYFLPRRRNHIYCSNGCKADFNNKLVHNKRADVKAVHLMLKLGYSVDAVQNKEQTIPQRLDIIEQKINLILLKLGVDFSKN